MLIKMFLALIDAGADLSITDDEGKTPLMQATINNNAKLVQVEFKQA